MKSLLKSILFAIAVTMLALSVFPVAAQAQIRGVGNTVSCGPFGACGGGAPNALGVGFGSIVGLINGLGGGFAAIVLSLAFFFLVYAGFRYVSSRGNEDNARAAKNQIIYAAIGIAVAVSAGFIVSVVTDLSTGDNTGAEAAGRVETTLIIPFTDFIAGLTATVSMIFLLWAAFQYITSRGEAIMATNAKRQIAFAATGITVAVTYRALRGAFVDIANGNPIGAATTVNGILDNFVEFGGGLIGIVSALFFMYAAYRYITSRGEAEAAASAKRQIAYAVIGIAIGVSVGVLQATFNFTARGESGLAIAEINPLLTSFRDFGTGLIAIISAIFLVYAGMRYITSQGDTEAANSARRQIIYAVMGIIISLTVSNNENLIFRASELTARTQDAEIGSGAIIGFLEPFLEVARILIYFAAVVFIIFAGARYINSQGEAESANVARRQIIYGILGIIVVVLADIIVSTVQTANTEESDNRLLEALYAIGNTFLSLAAVIAVAYVVLAGVGYITSQGDAERTERSKRALIYAGVGVIVIILSAVLVNFAGNAAGLA